jgi:hypothetical protein
MNKSATIKLDHFIQELFVEQKTGNGINKQIAQTIYDGKGTLWDDEASVIKVLGKIKNSKQYQDVKMHFKLVSSGKDLVTYIRSFTTIMDRLAIVAVLNGKISVPTLKTIVTYGDYKTAMLKQPSIANKFKIGKATASANNMLTTMTMNSKEWYGAQKKVDDASLTLADFNHEAYGDYDTWMETHSTWDTFINGANGRQDGIRSETYSQKGIVISTITSLIPATRIATGVFFGLLVADDMIRLSNGQSFDVVGMDLLVDLFGIFAMGGGAGIAKATLKPVVQLFAKIASGVKGKLLIPFIEAVQKISKLLINSKFGQMLKKLGAGIGNAITSLINVTIAKITGWLKLIAKKFPKLASWCNRIIKIISGIGNAFAKLFSIIWKVLKVLWKIISFPGKAAAWIVQQVTPTNVIIKGAFGAGAKMYVNIKGIEYVILPQIAKLMNPEVEDPIEKMMTNMEASLLGQKAAYSKTDKLICYNDKYQRIGTYKTFYVTVTTNNGTSSQPVCVMMNESSINGEWIEIQLTTDRDAYNIQNYNNFTCWVKRRDLITVNNSSVKPFIKKVTK